MVVENVVIIDMECICLWNRKVTGARWRLGAMAVSLIGSMSVSPAAMAKDLWELYSAAQRTNGNWAGQQYDYLATQKNVQLAFGDMLPQVGLQGSVKHNQFYPKDDSIPDTGNTASQVGIGLRQALFRADKWANYEKAVLASQANDIQLLQQHQQLIEQISKAYLNVLRAEAMTDSLNAEFTALKAQNDMMQARLAQGVAARVDTEESRARLESVSASIANNDVAIVNAKQQLSLLTGQPINQLDAIKLPPDLNLVASQSIENWMQQSQNNNLDIQLAQTQVAIANKQVDYLKANIYPRVDLVGNVGWQDYTHNNQSAIDGTNYSFGVEVDFPFYTGGRTRAGVEQGNLQAQAAKSRLAYVYQAAMTQTSQAYLNLVAQRATIKAQQTAVDANRRVAQASKTGYDLGVRSMVDTLLAERQYHAAKRDLINAYFDYLNAYIDLQKAAGNLTDDTVKVLDNQLI